MPFERPLGYSYMYPSAPRAAPAPTVVAAAPVATGTADELRKLAALHDAGHLTDEEFTAAKAKTLAS
jgi:hypothetical protein